MRSDRFQILCEDPGHEGLVRRWLRNLGIASRQLAFVIAPSGRGSGEAFVKKQFPEFVRKARSKIRQQGLGFIVMIDGDARGCLARKNDLELELMRSHMARREAELRVAIFVPTWNVETWLLYFSGYAVEESEQDSKRLIADLDRADLLNRAATGLSTLQLKDDLPDSLKDFLVEITRI